MSWRKNKDVSPYGPIFEFRIRVYRHSKVNNIFDYIVLKTFYETCVFNAFHCCYMGFSSSVVNAKRLSTNFFN